jgi:MoaA/NifB/PqqE/SkfB family radical SAM enzyme
MCSVRKGDYEISTKTLNFIKEQIPYLERILWQGGEVFLYKNFHELLDLAYKNNVIQGFITNGLLLDDKNIDLLLKYNISLSISIDSVIKEVYEKIRFGGKFENLIKILEKLYEKKKENRHFSYVMATVIMTDNYKEVELMVDFALKYGFKEIWFQLVKGNPSLSLNKEQEREFFESIKKSKKDNIAINTNTDYRSYILREDIMESSSINNEDNKVVFNDTNLKNDREIVEEAKNIPDIFNKNLICLAPWKTLFFDINARYKSSCYCHQYAFDDNIVDFWNSKAIIESRTKIINRLLMPECINCFKLGDCGSKNRLGLL